MSSTTWHVRRVRAAGAVVGVLALLLGLPAVAHAAPGDPEPAYAFADFTGGSATTDYDHRTVTLTGTLLAHDPDGGTDVPAAGQTVDLAQGTASGGDEDPDPDDLDLMGTVTTDAQGRFELADAQVGRPDTMGATPQPGPYVVTVYALRRTDPQQYGGWDAKATLDVTATPSTGRLTTDYRLGPPTALGRLVTAEGLFERKTALGWQPVQGVTLLVDYRPDQGEPFTRELQTGADGRFSVRFIATSEGTATTSLDRPADPYLDLAGPQTVIQEIAVPVVTATTPPPSPTTTAPRPTTRPTHAKTLAPVVDATSAAPPRPKPAPAATPTSDAPATAVPQRLAVTGDRTPRAAFLTGGSTLVAAGLLLGVVRRRMRQAR